MSQPGSSRKAPSRTGKGTAHVHSNSDGSLSCLSDAAQAVGQQRKSYARVYPPSFDLERSVGPKGRHSYSTATKQSVIDYTRLPRPAATREHLVILLANAPGGATIDFLTQKGATGRLPVPRVALKIVH